MNVVEPEQSLTVVMVRDAMDARQQQRIDRVQGAGRLTQDRHRDRVGRGLVERQQFRKDGRICDLHVHVVGVPDARAIFLHDRALGHHQLPGRLCPGAIAQLLHYPGHRGAVSVADQ
jgi:hypothetical protein